MTTRLTDDDLRRLKIKTAGHPAGDERVRALLSEIVASCPLSKIHWLEESREDILSGWLAERLLGGRLQAMIDKARHVGALRKLAEKDLHQYAAVQRRGELPTRLFKRLDKLLRANPQRYSPLMSSANPGSTYWTITSRPANAIFSERDHELLSHVFAVGLNTLEESVDAGKQTQFLIHSELDRYAYEMLERSARGLSLDQLVRGLVLAYELDPQLQELPDADALEAQLGSSATVRTHLRRRSHAATSRVAAGNTSRPKPAGARERARLLDGNVERREGCDGASDNGARQPRGANRADQDRSRTPRGRGRRPCTMTVRQSDRARRQ